MKMIRRLKKEAGASLIEYGLVAGLIAVASIGAVYSTGDKTAEIFCRASDAVAGAINGAAPECLDHYGMERMFGDLYGHGAGGGEVEQSIDEARNNMAGRGFEEGSGELSSDESGEQTFGFAIPNGVLTGGGPYFVSAETITPGVTAKACSGVTGAMICAPSYGNNTSTEILDGDTHVGYRVDIPEDPREGFEAEVEIKIFNGSGDLVYDSTGAINKPSAPIYADIPTELGHWDIERGTAGLYYLWVPIQNFNSTFRLLFDTNNLPNSSQVCSLNMNDEMTCRTSNVDIKPGEHKAIGVQINALPSRDTAAADYDINLNLVSRLDSSVNYDLHMTATREQAPYALSFGSTFDAVEMLPAGQTGNYYLRKDFEGEFNHWTLIRAVSSTGTGTASWDVCYWQYAHSTPNCDDRARQMNFYDPPHSIGILIKGITATHDRDYTLRMTSRYGGNFDVYETFKVRK